MIVVAIIRITVLVVVAVIAAGLVVVVVGVVVAADPTLETTCKSKSHSAVSGFGVSGLLRASAPTFSLTPKPALKVWKP